MMRGSVRERRGSSFLWREVYEGIEREIRTGHLPAGGRLPAEEALAETFGVHRHTVRRAIIELQQRGLVRGERGRGSFVRERRIQQEIGARTRLSVALHRANRIGARVGLKGRSVRADAEMADLLKVGRGAHLRRVDFVYVVDGQPLSLSSHLFPLPRFHGIDGLLESEGSITDALRRLGVKDYTRRETRIRAVALTGAQARQLKQSRARPALLLTKLNVDEAGTPIQLSYSIMSSPWTELVVRSDAPC